jgi:outer membrane protein TolC
MNVKQRTDFFLTAVTLAAGFLLLAFSSTVSAQARGTALIPPPGSPFLGGIPDPSPTSEPLKLSIADAIHRALDHNLGANEAEGGLEHARGTRLIALSDLLPKVDGTLSEARRKTNLEAFGFPLGPGFPRVVGPYNVFDARVTVTQTAFDLSAINDARAEGHNVAAARLSYRSARDVVVLVAANMYLHVLASAARAETARAQLRTAEALYSQAQDLKQGGIIAGIDVIRAAVRLSMDRQRRTAAENDFEKAKLQLARVIGLPIGQAYSVSDQLPALPVPAMTLEEALERAYRDRPDFLAAQERVRAAEAKRAAAVAEALPSVNVTADYGAIGLTRRSALPTYNIAGGLRVPIFQGGLIRGHVLEADADLRRRRAEADDLRAEVDYDVRSALMDLKATTEELQAATEARELANQQLEQSRDRFAAGVANNLEVIQAQEAVTLASEQYISALYGFNVSKALLAESLGTAEEAVQKYLGGSTP